MGLWSNVGLSADVEPYFPTSQDGPDDRRPELKAAVAGFRANHGKAQVGTDSHGHHVLGDLLAQTNPGIESHVSSGARHMDCCLQGSNM